VEKFDGVVFKTKARVFLKTNLAREGLEGPRKRWIPAEEKSKKVGLTQVGENSREKTLGGLNA